MGGGSTTIITVLDEGTLVQPGDVVVIHGGTYREAVVIEADGSVERPIGVMNPC
jgi:NADPH:quinone reductase-like Zn-dependent oxidoreductase